MNARLSTGNGTPDATRAAAAVLALAAALVACSPVVKHGVAQPLGLANPPTQFYVDRPEVSSREQDENSERLNREWVDFAASELRAALADRGKMIAPDAQYLVRARLYLAYEKTVIRSGDRRRFEPGFAEIQIRVVDRGTGTVLYSTFSKAEIRPAPMADWMGWGADTPELVRDIIRQAARDFATRL